MIGSGEGKRDGDHLSGLQVHRSGIGIDLYLGIGRTLQVKSRGEGGTAAGGGGKIGNGKGIDRRGLVCQDMGWSAEEKGVAPCPKQTGGQAQCRKGHLMPCLSFQEDEKQWGAQNA